MQAHTQTQWWVQEFTCVVVMEAKLLSVAADFPHAVRIIRDKGATE